MPGAASGPRSHASVHAAARMRVSVAISAPQKSSWLCTQRGANYSLCANCGCRLQLVSQARCDQGPLGGSAEPACRSVRLSQEMFSSVCVGAV